MWAFTACWRLVLALLVSYCLLVALNLANPIPVPSSPRVLPTLALPPDDLDDEEGD
jgi:hypothetical protein